MPLAVVTGGNRGIGLEVGRQLAARGYDVVMGSRDVERGRAAGLDVDVRQLDDGATGGFFRDGRPIAW